MTTFSSVRGIRAHLSQILINVGTNGKKIWDDVNTTVVVSKGRIIRINLADKDTQHHFMGQQIYGIVKKIVY
jgi:hypothetical protein